MEKRIVTKNEIKVERDGVIVYSTTRTEVQEELLGCRMDNNYGVCYKNAQKKLAEMNAAK